MGKIDLMKLARANDKRARELANWMDKHASKNLGEFLKDIIKTNELEPQEKIVLAFILGMGHAEKFKVPKHV
jgi:hypothetical protein